MAQGGATPQTTPGTPAAPAAPESMPATSVTPPVGGSDLASRMAALAGGGEETKTETPPPTDEDTSVVEESLADHPMMSKWYKGLQLGVSDSFGLKVPDEQHPGSLHIGDAASQAWDNLVKGAQHSYEGLHERFTGETSDVTDARPEKGIDAAKGVAAKAASAYLTPAAMVAGGVEGLASMIEKGSGELIDGIKTGDHDKMSRAVGKLLSSFGQIAIGAEKGMTSAEKSVAAAARARGLSGANAVADYRADALAAKQKGGGISRILRGAVNRGLDTQLRDIKTGSPAQAIMDETIMS